MASPFCNKLKSFLPGVTPVSLAGNLVFRAISVDFLTSVELAASCPSYDQAH